MQILELILNSTLLWIFLQTTWYALVSLLYDFCIPWIVWCSLLIAIGLKVARIPPPSLSIVKEVIGANLLSLNKDNSTTDNQSNGDQYCMRIVAHRGGGYDCPENSLLAFRNTKERGCTAVEFDLSLTKDNIPILFHDSTIERLTGQTGIVKEMTWDQLKGLDITFDHPLRNKFTDGERIALFYDVLEECLQNDQRIIIDVKETRLDIVQVILDAYKKYPKLYQRGIVSSFNPIIIYMIRRKDPEIVSSLAWRSHYFSQLLHTGLEVSESARFNNPFKQLAARLLDTIYEWALPRFVYYIVGISVILLHKDIVNQQVIVQWDKRDVRVMVWTVNLPSEKQYFSRNLKITYLTDTLLAEKIL